MDSGDGEIREYFTGIRRPWLEADRYLHVQGIHVFSDVRIGRGGSVFCLLPLCDNAHAVLRGSGSF